MVMLNGDVRVPDEVLLIILSQLGVRDVFRCAAVCGAWHELITRRGLQSVVRVALVKATFTGDSRLDLTVKTDRGVTDVLELRGSPDDVVEKAKTLLELCKRASQFELYTDSLDLHTATAVFESSCHGRFLELVSSFLLPLDTLNTIAVTLDNRLTWQSGLQSRRCGRFPVALVKMLGAQSLRTAAYQQYHSSFPLHQLFPLKEWSEGFESNLLAELHLTGGSRAIAEDVCCWQRPLSALLSALSQSLERLEIDAFIPAALASTLRLDKLTHLSVPREYTESSSAMFRALGRLAPNLVAASVGWLKFERCADDDSAVVSYADLIQLCPRLRYLDVPKVRNFQLPRFGAVRTETPLSWPEEREPLKLVGSTESFYVSALHPTERLAGNITLVDTEEGKYRESALFWNCWTYRSFLPN